MAANNVTTKLAVTWQLTHPQKLFHFGIGVCRSLRDVDNKRLALVDVRKEVKVWSASQLAHMDNSRSELSLDLFPAVGTRIFEEPQRASFDYSFTSSQRTPAVYILWSHVSYCGDQTRLQVGHEAA